MKKKHGLMIVLGALILPALLCSCGNRDGYNSKKHVEAAIKHMNEKYGAKFTLSGDNTQLGSGNVFGRHSEYVNILVSCDEIPGKDIVVFSNDGEKFFDDYICMKFEDQAHQDILDIAEDIYFGDEPVVMMFSDNSRNTRMSDRELAADTTYEEFLRSGAIGWVEICVDDRSDQVNKFRTLAKTMIEKGINCEPTVYHFVDNSYTAVNKRNPAQSIDFRKGCGQIRLDGFVPLLDEEFNGKLMISGDMIDSVHDVPMEPAPDETADTYAAYFKTRDQNESEASESRRAFLEDTSLESVAEWHGFNNYDDNGSLIDSSADSYGDDSQEETHKPVDSIDMGDISMPDVPKITTYGGF